MTELKTKVNNLNVDKFINSVQDDRKKQDSFKLLEIYKKTTGEKAKMWGTSIIGFGQYHYKSERSKQEGDWPLVGFSPRKQNLTLYFMDGFSEYSDFLQKLGKHKVSKSCLYINKLEDIDEEILKNMINKSFLTTKHKYN